jgi:CBS domain-containing protein
MTPDPITVPREATVAELVDNYIYKYHHSMFPVMGDGQLAGCIDIKQAKAVPRDEWTRQTVGAVATSCSPNNVVAPDYDAMKALALMNRTGSSRLLVVDGARLVGVITLKDLLSFLATKLELEG